MTTNSLIVADTLYASNNEVYINASTLSINNASYFSNSQFVTPTVTTNNLTGKGNTFSMTTSTLTLNTTSIFASNTFNAPTINCESVNAVGFCYIGGSNGNNVAITSYPVADTLTAYQMAMNHSGAESLVMSAENGLTGCNTINTKYAYISHRMNFGAQNNSFTNGRNYGMVLGDTLYNSSGVRDVSIVFSPYRGAELYGPSTTIQVNVEDPESNYYQPFPQYSLGAKTILGTTTVQNPNTFSGEQPFIIYTGLFSIPYY
jgi:hypothetical protein